jgi:hypothetical protein
MLRTNHRSRRNPKAETKDEWEHIFSRLMKMKPHESLTIEKSGIIHPSSAGFAEGTGFPRGQITDWRMKYRDTSIHVREFGDHYTVHRDRAHPEGVWGNVKHFVKDLPVLAGFTATITVYTAWKLFKKMKRTEKIV